MKDVANDKALQMFADLMIEKIKEVSEDFEKPWFSVATNGLPQNADGRVYHGINSLMLFMLCEKMNYRTPVFMTFLQAKTQGVNVLKGEKSFPVIYWDFSIKNGHGVKITMNEYRSLSDDEKKEYSVIPFTKSYNVFNVDQTNYSEIFPDKWEKLKQQFSLRDLRDEKGMLSCPQLDKMLKEDLWLCSIDSNIRDRAFYRPSEDKIYIPLKGQFKSGEKFYSTMLHEMAHSTGIDSRCARQMKNTFGDPQYAKEELVAECTAAVTCNSLGIVTGIQEHNAKYLKNWLNAIDEEPKFLYNVLAEVGKASTMILNEVKKYEIQKEEKKSVDTTLSDDKVKNVLVMTEEEYLASKGYSHFGIGEAALHKGRQKTARQQDRIVDLHAEKNRIYVEKREMLRREYQDKLVKGEIRRPSTIETMIATARGMPELESTMAARRCLEKRGIVWDEKSSENDVEKEIKADDKDFKSAFKTALIAASSGIYQPLVELKRKGFSPSASDVELLRNIAPEARAAVETIFHIKVNSVHDIKLADSDNKQEVKQLSLNF